MAELEDFIMSTSETLRIKLPSEVLTALEPAISAGEYACGCWHRDFAKKGMASASKPAQRVLQQTILNGIASGPIAKFSMPELIARA